MPEELIANPKGVENFAAVPIPSVKPITPEPANVLTIPEDVIFLILAFSLSATYTFPEPSTATPLG